MDEINIVEYDPQWQTLFAQEAERIWHALGNNLVVEVEHIGSTAVRQYQEWQLNQLLTSW